MKKLLAFCLLVAFLSACMSPEKCTVKANKKKFKYYNSLQFGGGTSYAKRKR